MTEPLRKLKPIPREPIRPGTTPRAEGVSVLDPKDPARHGTSAGTLQLNHGWTLMNTVFPSEPVSSSRNDGARSSVILIFSGGV